jgi:hypothetical protein
MRASLYLLFASTIFISSCGQSSTEENNPEKHKEDTTSLIQTKVDSSKSEFSVTAGSILIPKLGENNQYGYQDTLGNWIIKPQFYFASEFSNGMAVVSLKGLEWEIINENGTFLKTFGFEKMSPIILHNELSDEEFIYGFNDGLLPVKNANGKIGFMNEDFEMQIPFKYDNMSGFSEGVCSVFLKRENFHNNWGLIDKKGNWIIRPLLRNILPASCNRIIFYDSKLEGVMDLKGKVIVTGDYGNIFRYKEGLTFATRIDEHTNYFIMDTMGKEFGGPFDRIFGLGFENGECEVVKNGKCIIIDKTGKKIRDSKNGCHEGC